MPTRASLRASTRRRWSCATRLVRALPSARSSRSPTARSSAMRRASRAITRTSACAACSCCPRILWRARPTSSSRSASSRSGWAASASTPLGDLGQTTGRRRLDPESRAVLCVVAHFAFLDGGLMAQVTGFIGLGIMGRPMAKNLLKAGFPLVVHSRSRGPVDELVQAGAKAATSPRDVAAQCEVVITMLPNSPDVELVALGKDGIIEGARRGLIYVDMSTISPIVSQRVGKALASNGVEMLDAPVSGGEKGAIDAAVSIMVGGEKVVFDAVLPIFQAMGRTITRLGPLGSGGFTKLANQIIVAVNLTALAEALTLAKKGGLDRELTLTALAGGLARARGLDQKRPNYLANTDPPGFKIDLHYKDLGLIMDSARALGVPLPATAVVQELFNALRVKGRGGLDHSGVITLLEDLAGVSP